MASHWALLVLLAVPRALLGQPDAADAPCRYETNRIKDLLQASCGGKGLSQVPPDLQGDTGILLLGSNRLARVSTASFGHLPNLTDLDLSHNGMGELEAASPLPGLQELDLSHNALDTLPALQGFPSLRRLALGHNALSRLPKEGGFRALGRLEDLELQGNRLQSLPEGTFAGLAALRDLDLSDNRLTALPPGLLAGLGALETLRLERNRLRSVPEGFFPEEHLFAYVYLVGNPWLCNCALEYLRDWILENGFSVYTRVQGPEKEITEHQPENVTCHDPPGAQGRPVMNFHLDCRPVSDRGVQGDEEEEGSEPSPGPTTAHPDTLPLSAATTAFSAQSEPLPTTPPPPALPTSQSTPLALPTTTASPSPPPTPPLGGLATTRGVSTAPTTSPPELPPASTTATPAAHSPTTTPPSPPPTTPLGGLATTLPTARGVSTAPATTATAGPRAPVTPPSAPAQATMRTTLAPPTMTTRPRTLLLPATTPPPAPLLPGPPAYCSCPLLPGVALGLSGPQPSPVSWGAWLAARCCPLRLALYVACLALVSLPTLALLCWGVCACRDAWPPQARGSALGPQLAGYQPLQTAAPEGGGQQPLPRRRLYRACKRLEIGPLRYVSWLLVSLPGPSGRWPWEQDYEGSLGPGKDPLGAVRGKGVATTL